MNIVLGSAVTITSEIDSDQVSGTTITLASLIDKDGVDLSSGESLTFGTGEEANVASMVWQSTTSNLPGKYLYILKAQNGSMVSYAKGSFYLEEQ